MSNEKMCEGADWKDRLNQLDPLPGTEATWREDAWEKLYARLHAKEEKPRKKRIGWHWAAAACLVIVGAISLLPGRTVRPGRPGQPGQSQPSSAISLPSAGSVSAGQTPPSANGLNEQASVVYAVDNPERGNDPQATGKIMASRNNRGKKENGVSISPIELAKPDQLQDRPAVIADSIVLASATPSITPAPQRKLRVVHINELDLPVQDEAPSNHMAGNSFLRIHLLGGQPSTNLLMGSNNEMSINQSFKISFKK